MQSSLGSSHLPDPSRFQVFTQLANGKGFRIQSSHYIYFFDKFGGFYDEYNNYYNADGQPEEPPSDQDDDFERFVLEDDFHDGDDDDDYYDREYGAHDYDDHDYEDTLHHNEHQKTLEAIAKNATLLHQYPLKTPLRVDFHNMTFKTSKPDILKQYRSKLGQGLLNVILTQDQAKFTGEGYFVCKDVSVAEKLIKYEAEEFLGRKVYFDVEPFQHNLAEPVSKAEMDIAINEEDFVSLVKEKPVEEKQQSKNPKKKYFVKNQTSTQQPKKDQPNQQQKTSQTQKNQTPVQQNPQQIKKEQKKQPTWAKYHGQVTMFPKKTSFKDWMSSLGFKENEHFKNPQKAESKDPNKKFATVQLRSDVYDKIQGLSYQNSKVSFVKMN